MKKAGWGIWLGFKLRKAAWQVHRVFNNWYFGCSGSCEFGFDLILSDSCLR
ncbi:hypothetical protein B0S90_0637 [Caldicellulosiruptor bescii]|jgi:hypothetical protein|uniref:Uncharacterized protein n=1 Tax=Caldicellulosiruptor bescii TaxID=31899 RepID=A0ABY1SBI9_CALBS|nr:hypothetical protein [Caldicellulosiruptor bescii]PBC89857.1 hypothetical protein B0S89_0141 [Caldicellulosiruptor bescii]PBD05653.1 hypothetical protein B0S90_0637 [Caldicellulosiruptor bescii]PBD09345.1 hypothetical protein B0S84_1762 [Caldicellulosiruptor bescii]PFH15832.1 hypothetical protein B0S88_2349 [Caldicellulosiruptor bescii]PFH17496.1 hypothetical protein B0S93_1343 [Caldicellulosiruptor bescii]